jgi:Domain of unknown function (DUF4157)
VQTWQGKEKASKVDADTEFVEPVRNTTIKRTASTHVPAWANASEEALPAGLQTKLTVNQSEDVYEQEADRVAEQVMRISDGRSPAMRKEISLMPKANSGEQATQEAPSIVNQALSSNGQSLDAGTQEAMGVRFGQDFSEVRVHTDKQAMESAQAIHARAYTVGNDVVFGEGQYQPGTSDGQRLVAHELTHVVQQGAGHTRLPFVQRDDADGDAFTQFKITTADLKKPEITTKLNALSRTELLDYKGKVIDPKVKAYIDKLLAISMPLAEIGKDVKINADNTAQFRVNNVNVTIKPDTRTEDKKMENRAETIFQLKRSIPGAKTMNGKVTLIEPTKVDMIIQTSYGSGVTGESKSGYGRGTKPGEKDTTLRYHEGGHALDYIRYLKDNALPEFTGKVSMTAKEFKQAQEEYEAALKQYEQNIKDYSTANTDCIGTTIDDFNHVHGVKCK